jgi:hypothetical protein
MTPYERLKFVRDLIDGIPEDQVRMSTWIYRFGVEGGCGTVGCVIGHAGLTPEMQAEGLTLIRPSKVPKIDGRSIYGCDDPRLAKFFGLTESQSEDLFTPFLNNKTHFLRNADKILKRSAPPA